MRHTPCKHTACPNGPERGSTELATLPMLDAMPHLGVDLAIFLITCMQITQQAFAIPCDTASHLFCCPRPSLFLTLDESPCEAFSSDLWNTSRALP
eukprot:6196053-Pleurochrysis_carterae.AAC.1